MTKCYERMFKPCGQSNSENKMREQERERERERKHVNESEKESERVSADMRRVYDKGHT